MDIIELARNFAKNIQKTEEYENLEKAKKNNDSDKNLCELIEKFNKLKLEFQNLEEGESELADKKSSELNELYDLIMANENMVKFNAASHEMNGLMNKINRILIFAVNGGDPMECSVSEKFECGGNCEGCHNCGQ